MAQYSTAYGVFIDIDGSEETIREVLAAQAERTVEVAVKYRGVQNEFTLVEFLERLGFCERGEVEAT